jgi:hypothetical protein
MIYDKYVSLMNKIDKNRNVRNMYNYKPNIYQIQPDLKQKMTLIYDKIGLNIQLSKYKRLNRIEYVVEIFDDRLIENGYPHTVGNKIMLPINYYFSLDRMQRMLLLIHEVIHIYQRYNPFDFNCFLVKKLGLKVVNLSMKDFQETKRTNPDINGILYDEGGKYNVMIYNSMHPKNLADASVRQFTTESASLNKYNSIISHYRNTVTIQHEHPYETLACILAYVIQKEDVTCPIVLKQWLSCH